MRFGVLGTGIVGRTIGSKLVELGHEVAMGSRDAANETAASWAAEAGERAQATTFAGAADFGEIVVNATSGSASLAALELAGADNLSGKVIIDVANPLDFSRGMPPSLTVGNTDSLGEQIQRAYPDAKVVKALNTMNADVMVTPNRLSGPHVAIIGGDDSGAKQVVTELLETFGWPRAQIIDLGGINVARGTEGFLLLWIRLYQSIGSGAFNIGIVRE
jgi:predicted dinucleotide-binding enzyme